MKMVVCAVFDSKVGAYLMPFFCRTKAEAMRSFEDGCRRSDLPFKDHPGDFRLWCLGEFDDSDGQLVGMTPYPLIGADEILELQGVERQAVT